MSLSGQWVAQYTGDANSGTIVIEIDEVDDHYEGAACLWDNNPSSPSSLVGFRTFSKKSSHTMPGLQVVWMDNRGNFLNREQLTAMLPAETNYPVMVDARLDLQGSTLSVQWTTPGGSFDGTPAALATKTRAGEESEITPRPLRNWAAFKGYVNGLERRRYVFRGQEDNRWRLRSSFYRTGRANMERFVTTEWPSCKRR